MSLLFWELHQQARIREAQETASDARTDIREQSRLIEDLERQVERLSTAVVALAEILQEYQGVSAAVIEAKMREVELRRVTLEPTAKRCLACDRVSSPERTTCMYCGKPLPAEPFLPAAE